MQSEVEEAIQECRNAEEKAKKAITDVSQKPKGRSLVMEQGPGRPRGSKGQAPASLV